MAFSGTYTNNGSASNGSVTSNTEANANTSNRRSKVSSTRRSSASNQNSLLAVSSFICDGSGSSFLDDEDSVREEDTIVYAKAQHAVIRRATHVNSDGHHSRDSVSVSNSSVKETSADCTDLQQSASSSPPHGSPDVPLPYLPPLPDALRSHPPGVDDMLEPVLQRSQTAPSKRKTNFSPERLDIDTSIARKWQGTIIGTPYPYNSQSTEGHPNMYPNANKGKRSGKIWDQSARLRSQNTGTRLESVVRGSEGSIPELPDVHESSAKGQGLDSSNGDHHTCKRNLAGALEPGIEQKTGTGQTPNTHGTEPFLTIVVRHPVTKIPKSKPIAIPRAKDTDDQKLASAIRAGYGSLRGKWRRWLSARTLAHIKVSIPTSEMGQLRLSDRDIETYGATHDTKGVASLSPLPDHQSLEIFENFYITAIVRNPSLGKGSTKLIAWARDKSKNNKSTKRIREHGGTNKSGVAIEDRVPDCYTTSTSRLLEVKEGWAITRIICVVFTVLVLSILSMLLWIFLGPGGNRYILSPDAIPIATAIDSGNDFSAATSSYGTITATESLVTAQTPLSPEFSNETSEPAWETTGSSVLPAESLTIEDGGAPDLASELFSALAPIPESLPTVTPNFREAPPATENLLTVRMAVVFSVSSGAGTETGNAIGFHDDSSERNLAMSTAGSESIYGWKSIREPPKRTLEQPIMYSKSPLNETSIGKSVDSGRRRAPNFKYERVAGALVLGLWVLAVGMLLVGGWLGISWIAG